MCEMNSGGGDKAIITCALTGVLTNPAQHPVPVTVEEMATSAKDAYNAGAAVMHVHFRRQEPGQGHLPSWQPELAERMIAAIREGARHFIRGQAGNGKRAVALHTRVLSNHF